MARSSTPGDAGARPRPPSGTFTVVRKRHAGQATSGSPHLGPGVACAILHRIANGAPPTVAPNRGEVMRELFRRQPRFTSEPQSEDSPVVPDDLWVKCPRCRELTYSREFERELRVCPRCNHHFRLTAAQRIAMLTDPGSFVEWDAGLEAADPLGFAAGGESYPDKVATAKRKSGTREALVTGSARLDGRPLALAVAEFGFMGASMGSVFGEKLVRAIERAIEQELPLVTVSSSGGARMQESPFSLMQMAKTTAALARLGEARLPHIAV